ncbi:MAG: hypothetical protein D6696_17700, partial [Acidobacteria bacterium]
GGTYWLEYRLVGPGTGLAVAGPVSGAFPLAQRRVVFGPVPRGFWNDLAAYGPYRVRVIDAAGRRRSPWITFTVE